MAVALVLFPRPYTTKALLLLAEKPPKTMPMSSTPSLFTSLQYIVHIKVLVRVYVLKTVHKNGPLKQTRPPITSLFWMVSTNFRKCHAWCHQCCRHACCIASSTLRSPHFCTLLYVYNIYYISIDMYICSHKNMCAYIGVECEDCPETHV